MPPTSSGYERKPNEKPPAFEQLITRRVLACFRDRKLREGEHRKERKKEKTFQ
jgi:hypothetical protein